MPTQIQLNAVKMVEFEPESAVPLHPQQLAAAGQRAGGAEQLNGADGDGDGAGDLKSQIGHNIGFQTPISIRSV